MKLRAILIAVAASVWLGGLALAQPTRLHQQINGIACTVDELYDGPVPTYIINPEVCSSDPIASIVINRSDVPVGTRANTTAPNASEAPSRIRKPLDDALARYVGIDATKIKPYQPVLFGAGFIIVMFFVVDAAFFSLVYSRRSYHFTKRQYHNIKYRIKR